MEFESRVMEVVEPRLKGLRELFQDRDVQAPDLSVVTHLLLEAKFELLKLGDLAGILTRSLGDDQTGDTDEDQDDEVPQEKIVDEVLNSPMTNYQRNKIMELLSSVDKMDDKMNSMMDDITRLSDRVEKGNMPMVEALKGISDIIANYQIDDIADKVDQIYDELKPGSLFPKIGNTVSWIDHNVKGLQSKLKECCDTMKTDMQQLINDVGQVGDMVGDVAQRLDVVNTGLIDCCNTTNNNLNNLSQQITSGFETTNQEVGSLRDNILSAIAVIP